MNKTHKFNYDWSLKYGYPAKGIESNNLKVFSTFACGGGSTMGYKLAGYTVIGANDIDEKMAAIYKENHKPKFYNLCPISDLLDKDLPKEYYELDILDGSPPCSTFSMSGSREKAWKVDKKFAEGQAKQQLSDLFFEWIKLVDKLRPKVAIAENVKGMIQGNSKIYVKKVFDALIAIGYDVQLFLLNSGSMGVPQKRERVFFICQRKDMNFPKLRLKFNEPSIKFGEVSDIEHEEFNCEVSKLQKELLLKARPGEALSKHHPTGNWFNYRRLSNDMVASTLITGGTEYHPIYNRKLTTLEIIKIGAFPMDYNFLSSKPRYVIGMSVPPLMTAQIAHEINNQWFKIGVNL